MAADLPWDIIVNILSRLAVRDLLRYRSVVKPWCALIDDHDFIRKHLNHAMKTSSNLGVAIRERDLYWMNLHCPDVIEKLHHPLDDGGRTELLGSCNGLLALFNSPEEVALWNPATRRYRRLPNSVIEFPCEAFPYIMYGFGHDPVGDCYKLVRVVQFCGSFYSEVKVYSSKTDTWKRIRDFPYYIQYTRVHAVLASNAVHWVVSRNSDDVTWLVVAFDLVTEEYRKVPLPGFKRRKIHINLEVLRGSLCLLCNFPEDGPSVDWDSQSKRVDLWMMKEYGVKESWTKLFSVAPMDETTPFRYILPVAYVPAFGDRVILLDQGGRKLLTYDLELEKAKDTDIYSTSYVMETVVCVESLVRLDGGDGKNGWTKGPKSKKTNEKQEKKKKDDFLSQGFKLVL